MIHVDDHHHQKRSQTLDYRHFEFEHYRSDSRSEEHTSELQSPCNLVCRLLLEKKNSSARRSHTSPSLERSHTFTTILPPTTPSLHAPSCPRAYYPLPSRPISRISRVTSPNARS